MKISVFSCFNSLPLAMPPHCNFPQIWTLWPHTYTYTHTHTQTTHVHKPPLSYVYIIYVFCHYTLQFSSDLPLYKAILCPYSESEKIWHRKLRKLTFTLKADNSSHCKQNKNLREYFFFFLKGNMFKRGISYFLNTWIFNDKLTVEIFTLSYVLHF